MTRIKKLSKEIWKKMIEIQKNERKRKPPMSEI